ncbi:DUF4142 domain-containing protein [Streptomyces gamaensis]|uniref:DUF4142 domain-containing protein n=1 Tax=Streptomyces gamaensis TaxID=1763542 RepID=A0ABW0Z1J3_9ACTN
MRMRHRAATALAALALATVPAAGTAQATDDEGHDTAFLTTFHQGNMAEIAMGKDTAKNATTRCVRETGKVFVRDHTRLDKELVDLAGRLRVTLPAGPSEDQQKELSDLRTRARTKTYDRKWLESARTGHEQTLQLMETEIKSGKNDRVRELARKAKPFVAEHLDRVVHCMGGKKDTSGKRDPGSKDDVKQRTNVRKDPAARKTTGVPKDTAVKKDTGVKTGVQKAD